jgi:hypothetical protein
MLYYTPDSIALLRDIASYWKPAVRTTILGYPDELKVSLEVNLPTLDISLPNKALVKSQWAWSIKFEGVIQYRRRKMP